VHCRTLLNGIGALVVPKEFSLSGAYQAFTEEGSLVDEEQTARLKKTVEQYVNTLKKLVS
jgi:NAD(P)H-dependent FMN reductase